MSIGKRESFQGACLGQPGDVGVHFPAKMQKVVIVAACCLYSIWKNLECGIVKVWAWVVVDMLFMSCLRARRFDMRGLICRQIHSHTMNIFWSCCSILPCWAKFRLCPDCTCQRANLRPRKQQVICAASPLPQANGRGFLSILKAKHPYRLHITHKTALGNLPL